MTAIAEYELQDRLTGHAPMTEAEHAAVSLHMLADVIASGLPAPIAITVHMGANEFHVSGTPSIATLRTVADILTYLPVVAGAFRAEARLRVQLRDRSDLAAWLTHHHVREPKWEWVGAKRHARWPAIAWAGMPYAFACCELGA